MNRRDLLTRLAAIPLLGSLVPVRADNGDGVALKSCAHPESLRALDEQADINPASLETMELDLPEHEFDCNDFCIHCRASCQSVVDNLAERACWSRLAAQRHRALVASMDQTWSEALRKMPWPWQKQR